MPRLTIQAFGGLCVREQGRELAVAASCRPLLGYLLARRDRRISRQELAATLWAGRAAEDARHCLSTALWRLRQGGAGRLLAPRGDDDLVLDWSATTWVDCVAFEHRVRPLAARAPASLAPAELARLERGLRLYRGGFLAGLDDEWALLERRRLGTLWCDGMVLAMRAHAAAARWPEALRWARQAAHEEPLREDVQRTLMTALAQCGGRAAALTHYRGFERLLMDELGVAPMPETQALARALAAPAAPAAPPPRTAGPAAQHPQLAQTARRLRRLQRVLSASLRELNLAMDEVTAPPPSP